MNKLNELKWKITLVCLKRHVMAIILYYCVQIYPDHATHIDPVRYSARIAAKSRDLSRRCRSVLHNITCARSEYFMCCIYLKL